MKKIFLIFTFAVLLKSFCFGETLLISDFVIYDGEGKRIEKSVNPANVFEKKFSEVWFEGLLNFKRVTKKDSSAVYTVLDANKVCLASGANYLLYGYVQQNEKNYFSNAKLYSAGEKKIVKEFFASDSDTSYERMLDDLFFKVLDGVLEIAGIENLRKNEDSFRECELNIRPEIFYWVPMNKNWCEKIVGIAGTGLSLDFFPIQPFFVVKNIALEISARFNIAWSCAINQKDWYPLFLNNIIFASPAIAHFNFDSRHSAYIGLGPGYELSLMTISPKYESKKLYYASSFFLQTVLGYEYRVKDSVKIFSENVFDFHLTGTSYVALCFSFGVSFNLYKNGGMI